MFNEQNNYIKIPAFTIINYAVNIARNEIRSWYHSFLSIFQYKKQITMHSVLFLITFMIITDTNLPWWPSPTFYDLKTRVCHQRRKTRHRLPRRCQQTQGTFHRKRHPHEEWFMMKQDARYVTNCNIQETIITRPASICPRFHNPKFSKQPTDFDAGKLAKTQLALDTLAVRRHK